MLDFSVAATDSGPLYTSVFYCCENILFILNLSVPGGFMVIGAHVTINNGGDPIYGATLVTPSLKRVPS